MISGSASYKLDGMKKFQRAVEAGSSNSHVRGALRQWAARYRAFVQRRFVRYGRGGGDWPPLKQSTIRARRGKGVGVAILRDTGTLFSALGPVLGPGGVEEVSSTDISVTVGIGGPQRHPGGQATIADIASFHQVGAGFLPRREIIVQPDAQLVSSMTGDMLRAIGRIQDDSQQ